MKERDFERIGYWICVAILAGMALVVLFGMAESLVAGQVRTVSKNGGGILIAKTSNPVGFFAAFIPQALIFGTLSYCAYWVWSTYLRRP